MHLLSIKSTARAITTLECLDSTDELAQSRADRQRAI